MKTPLNALMQKEMDRKQFLAVMGFGMASVFGLGALLKLLGHRSPLQQPSVGGYGASAYGGRT